MQQAIYTNTHTNTHNFKSAAVSGHGTGAYLGSTEDPPQIPRFKKLRLVLSVLGNVLGGTVLLSGMLILPQLVVCLLAG